MAYTAVPTQVTGDTWSATEHNTYVKDNFAAVLPDIATTKGGLWVATAANAATELAVGSDDNYFIADSAQSAGVKWGTADIFKKTVLTRGSNLTHTGTETAIPWTSEVVDDEGLHSASSSTITFGDGFYLIMMFMNGYNSELDTTNYEDRLGIRFKINTVTVAETGAKVLDQEDYYLTYSFLTYAAEFDSGDDLICYVWTGNSTGTRTVYANYTTIYILKFGYSLP